MSVRILPSRKGCLTKVTGLLLRSPRKPAWSFRWAHTNNGKRMRTLDPQGPSLQDFVNPKGFPAPAVTTTPVDIATEFPYLNPTELLGNQRKVFFEVYGCQMNVSDTEIAWSVLKDAGYERTVQPEEADVLLAVTCAIRENAEKKVWDRLNFFKKLKQQGRKERDTPVQIGVLGCMAERLKENLLEKEKLVDLVAGPDSYKDLPRMLALANADDGNSQVNVALSLHETYSDISPVRLNSATSAFVSIQRGCDNMCAFCIVPFTRGRERSRTIESIAEEVAELSRQGVKEITLLGQNVNSYRDTSTLQYSLAPRETVNSDGFKTIYKPKKGGRRFADLLDAVAQVDPDMRIRFTSPHPKDFPTELLQVIGSHHNVCNALHLPIQSGSTEMLGLMRRGHTREAYLRLVEEVRLLLPNVTISSDFISGFCGETEEHHQDTLSLMDIVKYDHAFMFAYSMRPRTHAAYKYKDDVPQDVKLRRLGEVIDMFQKNATVRNASRVGQKHIVLVDGLSKRSDEDLVGRTDGNVRIVFPKEAIESGSGLVVPTIGDYVVAEAHQSSSRTLVGKASHKLNSLAEGAKFLSC